MRKSSMVERRYIWLSKMNKKEVKDLLKRMNGQITKPKKEKDEKHPKK